MPGGGAPAPGDRCPRCDAAFACGIATGACWCAEVTVTAEQRDELAARYDGCLCQTCLRDVDRGVAP